MKTWRCQETLILVTWHHVFMIIVALHMIIQISSNSEAIRIAKGKHLARIFCVFALKRYGKIHVSDALDQLLSVPSSNTSYRKRTRNALQLLKIHRC